MLTGVEPHVAATERVPDEEVWRFDLGARKQAPQVRDEIAERPRLGRIVALGNACAVIGARACELADRGRDGVPGIVPAGHAGVHDHRRSPTAGAGQIERAPADVEVAADRLVVLGRRACRRCLRRRTDSERRHDHDCRRRRRRALHVRNVTSAVEAYATHRYKPETKTRTSVGGAASRKLIAEGPVLRGHHDRGALPVGIPLGPPVLIVPPHRTDEPIGRLARDARHRRRPWCQIDGSRADLSNLQGCLRAESEVYSSSRSIAAPVRGAGVHASVNYCTVSSAWQCQHAHVPPIISRLPRVAVVLGLLASLFGQSAAPAAAATPPIVTFDNNKTVSSAETYAFDTRWMVKADRDSRLNSYRFALATRSLYVAWGISDEARAMVNMFEVTGDPKYLDHLRDVGDAAFSKRDDQKAGIEDPTLCLACTNYVDYERTQTMAAWSGHRYATTLRMVA